MTYDSRSCEKDHAIGSRVAYLCRVDFDEATRSVSEQDSPWHIIVLAPLAPFRGKGRGGEIACYRTFLTSYLVPHILTANAANACERMESDQLNVE